MKPIIATAALLLTFVSPQAATLQEDFAADPASRGWRVSGAAELFGWDSTTQSLQVHWDSAKPNSYFYRPLNAGVGKNDDLLVAFDLQLDSIRAGGNPGKPFSFELAVGLINARQATSTNFTRGTGSQAPDLVEFDYFPDTGFGATISPTITSSNSQFATSFTFPAELTVNDLFHVEMRYAATNHTLTTSVLRNGAAFTAVKDVVLGPEFTDFQVDAVSINSYSDAGAGGSIDAKGRIDNLAVVYPDPPSVYLQGQLADHRWSVTLASDPGWLYTLERTLDWQPWQAATPATPGTGSLLTLADELPSADPAGAFYRVRLEKR